MSQTKAELIEPQGNVAFDTNTLYVDAGNNRVGIGTTSPQNPLHVVGTGGIRISDPTNAVLNIRGDSGANSYLYFAESNVAERGVIGYPAGSGDLVYRSGANSFSSGNERFRCDSSGRLLVGTSSARANFYNSTGTAQLQVEGSTQASSSISVTYNDNGVGGPVLTLNKSRSVSVGGNTIVSSGDALGNIYFQGNDGTEFVEAALIRAEVDGTPGANDMPGRLVFSTTADGASSPTERMRISADGATAIFNSPKLFPVTDNAVLLGQSGNRWSAVWSANGTIQTSDERAKAEIADSSLGTDFVKSLRPVSYKWIEGGKRDTGERDENGNYIYESVPGTRTHWGFIAQEVKQAVDAAGVDFGGWVLTDKDDPDSQQALRYDQFIAPLTKALQEALAEIDVLKAKVAALETA